MELVQQTANADGITEFTFLEDNAYAVDQFFSMLKSLLPAGTKPYVYIDMTGLQMYSVRYLATELRAFTRDRRDDNTMYLAMIVDGSMVNLTSSLLKTILQRDTVQYFTQPDKARLWLRMEKQKSS